MINGQIRCAAQLGEGRIDLGYIAPLSSKFVPELVRAFLQHPEYACVTFGLQELPTPELLTGLRQYRHDVVFCIQDSGAQDVDPYSGLLPLSSLAEPVPKEKTSRLVWFFSKPAAVSTDGGASGLYRRLLFCRYVVDRREILWGKFLLESLQIAEIVIH